MTRLTASGVGERGLPYITWEEYHRLLQAAQKGRLFRTYLLVKVFACTGIRIQELPQITVEAAKEGHVTLPEQHRAVYLPHSLRRELLDYAGREGISQGPIFVTRTGKLVSRSNITASVQNLSKSAQVGRDKCNPRCLRRLYFEMLDSIWRSLTPLVEQRIDKMVGSEQLFPAKRT